MILRPSKTRFLCSAVAVAVLQSSSMAYGQPIGDAASVAPMPAASLAPVEASVAPAPGPFGLPGLPGPLAPSASDSAARPDVSFDSPLLPPPLKVMYSYVGMDGSRTKPVMDTLRVVGSQSTHNLVAQQVALNVALVLLTGGLALGIRPFAKEDLSGIEPEGAVDKARLQNPALSRLPAELEKRATVWLAANEKTKDVTFREPLIVSSGAWRLVYDSLLAKEETYQLKFDASIYKSRDKPTLFKGNKQAGKACEYSSDARPLAAWKDTDYQAVTDLMPLAIEKCSAEFVAQLPQLLELD